MSGILNVGTRALQANQSVLQVAGNNIANVNTPGYSRQSAVLQAVEGQFSGGGYVGKGVDLLTIQRNYSSFLTRQSALAGSTSAGDAARADKLKQLEGIFAGGPSGLGAAVNDMLNAFSDVANAPTDLTARTVALTRVSETALRMRSTSKSLDDLQAGVTQEVSQKVAVVNVLSKSIGEVNNRIAKALGSGQSPNDLLDQRDQLVRELNKLVQTTSVLASDGTVGIFLGGSQALVLGSSVSTLSVSTDEFTDPLKAKVQLDRSGQLVTLDESTLGGGEISGLLRFQNTDLAEGRNLLGRLTLGISTAMNDQHKLGLDLDGVPGGNLFTTSNINTPGNILKPASQAVSAGLTMSIADVTKFAASDYEFAFGTAATGTITRRSDGKVTAFDFTVPQPNPSPLPAPNTIYLDGLHISWDTIAANVGDRFLLKPFSTSATDISAEFSTPRALAVASPVAGKMATTNAGSLQVTSLVARTNPPTVETTTTPVVLTFTGPNSYTRSDEIPPNTTTFAYLSGKAIEGSVPATTPLTEWSLVLQGTPRVGDRFTVFGVKDAVNSNGIDLRLNSGNATALMNLRDKPMFDESSLVDGYAGVIAQVGVRAQSANYSADVSSAIAATLEKDRTSVSGVNLDEEASKLIQYQQAYQASAKVIQIAQSIFDTLIRTMSG